MRHETLISHHNDTKLLISISHNCSLLILLSPSRNFLICPYAFHFGKSQKEILRCKTRCTGGFVVCSSWCRPATADHLPASTAVHHLIRPCSFSYFYEFNLIQYRMGDMYFSISPRQYCGVDVRLLEC